MLKNGTYIADRYEVVGQIGTGGMSDVYKAKDHTLGRYVAIKVLKEEFSEDTNFVTKFRSEAQAAAGLEHPNIVNIYDVGSENGIHYIVMEYVEGITLKTYIEKKGQLNYKETLSIAIQVSRGIQAAHAKHIIHRDIKPANIMVSPKGYFKLGDFGVARQQISGTMTVIGSYDFMAPEVYKGMPYDQTADIYSLGMVLYYLANDFKLPFSEIQSSIDRINRRMNGDTEWDWKQKLSSWGIATNIKQKMSEEILYDTVMTACANDPKARYQSATAMKRNLMICMDKICACEKRKDNWEAAKKK